MFETVSLEQLYDWDRHHYWHAFTQMAEYEPLVIERAEGVWLYDTRGRRLLDGASSMWCNVHGHNHPAINRAIVAQIEKGAHITSLGMSSPPAIELARRLVEVTPAGLEHVFFSSDGSSANEVALKAAFQYWRQCDDPRPTKTKYLAFGQAYHGDTLGAASVGGIAKFHAVFEPLLFEVVRIPPPDVRRLPTTMPTAQQAEFFLAEAEAVLASDHESIAAIIIEPLMQGAAGMAMQPAGYLRGLRRLADQYNVLLIADEVATGFGRTGTMFACEREEVVPDFLTLGKGLTGGYLPMAATLTTTKVWSAFLGDAASSRALYHGHTYSGNPTTAAAALASLDLFETEETLTKLPAKIERLGARLARVAEHPHVANPRQCGLVVAFDLVANQESGEAYPAEARVGERFAKAALEREVWLRARPDMVYAIPPLAITLEEIDHLMDAVDYALEESTASYAT